MVRLVGLAQIVGPLLALAGLALTRPDGVFWPGVLATVVACTGLGAVVLMGRAGRAANLSFLCGATTLFVTIGLASSDPAGLAAPTGIILVDPEGVIVEVGRRSGAVGW
jgi:hypothetical protein